MHATPSFRHVREVGAYGQVNQVAVVVKTAGVCGLGHCVVLCALAGACIGAAGTLAGSM